MWVISKLTGWKMVKFNHGKKQAEPLSESRKRNEESTSTHSN